MYANALEFMHQNFIIQKWSVWPPQQQNEQEVCETQKELLSTLPKMLKRRLTPLARTVFSAAKQCIADDCQTPTIFSSTHGELAKSFAMMEMIEAGEEISPTAFSLSVHNAIAGLFSMAYKNKMQSTMVAPGEEGIAAAFIEVVGLLQEGSAEVLLLFYDEPLVKFYPSAPYQLSTEESSAVALCISATGSGQPVKFSCQNKTGNDGEQPLQLPLLRDFLTQDHAVLKIHTPRHSWCWEKYEQTT